MTPALLSALILVGALILFVSEKVRHDLVALIALFACVALGLTKPADAFAGFADPAVLAVAAILVVGRAIELSGIAAGVARVLIPTRAGFTVRLAMLLVVGAFLSAFMNNIAALVITMPIAAEIARTAKRPPAATLMPLAFATILGGMTTLIGTPANLILSSVREKELGAPFGFFTMAPVGTAVALLGLVYLALVGWRLLPIRETARRAARPPWRVYELAAERALPVASILPKLRAASVRMLALFRDGVRVPADRDAAILAGDRLLVVSRQQQWVTATATGLHADTDPEQSPDAVTARVAVAHGSFLIGLSHEAVRIRSAERVRVVAVGPRAARRKVPLSMLRIEAGDQLYVRGKPADLATFVGSARLLEIDRLDMVPLARRRALPIAGIFFASIVAIVAFGAPPALAFLAAAVILAATRLIPSEDIYRSIDWSVIVLLAAMIPVGQSFETSGAAEIAAHWLGTTLAGLPLFWVIAALCSVTMLLSIFLNNVATAIIMGPLAIDAAHLLGISADAALLAVLIGASSDFLTPIGHQNNLLVMGPGGYRFTDYARMGALLVVIVIVTAAATLSIGYR
ncbi:SLC13 family permease [Sphingomonas sp. 10B4]|uniref:SLC13 family permease n=1 Tax=Sphingomonas sp. 10B4 TaxID=3048575 RepID=UPI002AB4478E|nr:SLC13 family permease [Sphingomonas sp. 10B4]MDY7524607.1 SLC13 family permease [Sphingomonas sp. 10B4]MEB0282436.1 SLC13 family permease [Sphingomonas sp. 10B4]